ncbi:hypothetical protein SY88_08135 [Clostridiales bacterium PH28_bin88]|nr:hypothetical protein SY88_08135 [Clostridiales bacterium PH28_bin88]
MKILQTKPDMCTECHACEDACSFTLFKEEDREKAALRIGEFDPGTGMVAMTTCDQCGECIDLCPAEAIYRDQGGIVMINKDECVGCYACVGFCPRGAMFMHHHLLEPFKCTSCGACAEACPSGAVSLEEVPLEGVS